MKILVINGPNINMLGIREPGIYGSQNFDSLQDFIKKSAADAGVEVELFQSNHEGSIVDTIQKAYGNTDGIVINPAAYTHTSVAILDALKSVAIPAVEVHISDVSQREDFRQVSYARHACVKTIMGLGFEGYRQAILFLRDYLTSESSTDKKKKAESNVIKVKASQSYDVIVDSGILLKAGEYIRAVSKTSKAVVVCGDIVDTLYSDTVTDSLRHAGFDVLKYVIPHGEQHKNKDTLFALLEFLAENGVSRSDILVALGGGVTGDLTGCAAAFYMRGIQYVQIPTTLLAAVDSSVGGKTAIDLSAGKNLAGAFKQPLLVICDTDTLKTLPEEEFAAGMGEVIKYGLLCDAELFSKLESSENISRDIPAIIKRCVTIKRDVVAADEFDTGARQTLNLGHTLAHAIEKCSNFEIKHGHAVAIGMIAVAKCAYASGLADEEMHSRLSALCSKYKLPTCTCHPLEVLCSEIVKDKKRNGSKITLVIPRRIGETYLYKTDMDKLNAFFSHIND